MNFFGVVRKLGSLQRKKIDPPKDIALEEGLIGLNAPMLMHNRHHEVEMSERALGVRMTGCAGIELIALVLGQRAGYISNLAPWDYALAVS